MITQENHGFEAWQRLLWNRTLDAAVNAERFCGNEYSEGVINGQDAAGKKGGQPAVYCGLLRAAASREGVFLAL